MATLTTAPAAAAALAEIKDPVQRGQHAKALMAELADAITVASAARESGVAELHADGWSLARIAAAFEVSRPRAQQLVDVATKKARRED